MIKQQQQQQQQERSTTALQLKGLFILALCLLFTVIVFWVARVIHAASVVWSSVFATATLTQSSTEEFLDTRLNVGGKPRTQQKLNSWKIEVDRQERQGSAILRKCASSKG